MRRAHLGSANGTIQFRWERRRAITQTNVLANLHVLTSSPAPCIAVILFNCIGLHLVVCLDTRACFILLDGIAVARAIGAFLGREVWQGSLGTTDIITDFNILAEVCGRVVFRQFILRDAATLGKIVTSIIVVGFDVFASTSNSTGNEGSQHQSSKEGHDVGGRNVTLKMYTEETYSLIDFPAVDTLP